ncbi:MAG TPA: protocatechuate 3,4-dioxygenase subunit alpha [Bauldia sp.]|nr:protocatechuate 3,4-dioxygenase subunit alpha [Bauldia sp.]
MAQPLARLKESPSQTGGPYVHIGLTPNFSGIDGVYPVDHGAALVNDKTRGERVTITGTVFDGADAPVRDCVVEIWQADADGYYPSPNEWRGAADPNFAGWGRSPADPETGRFRFETVKPGRVPFADGGLQAPHVSFWIVARGINLGLNTRMYFGDEAAANADDPLLRRIEHKDRVATLVAARSGNTYTFDIRLQGPRETVFLDI